MTIATRTLETGGLRFTALVNGDGPLVLLLHGFPDGPETFKAQLEALAQAGFRAVAVTLRGYEASSQVSAERVSVADLAEDVFGWMDALGEQQAHLIGHDWGATIAFAASKQRPERVLSLSMLAVPHPMQLAMLIQSDKAQLSRSSYILFFQLRGFSDFWVGLNRAAFIERLWRKWSPGWAYGKAQIAAVRRRFAKARVRTLALEYYRQAANTKAPRAAESGALLQGEQPIRTLGLCGENDGCISADIFKQALRTADFPAGLTVRQIDRAGHFLHAEQPDAVNAALLAWLTSAGPQAPRP